MVLLETRLQALHVNELLNPERKVDVESMRTLEKLAQRWNVSKSEVLRRAIRIAAIDGSPGDGAALGALDRLQASLRSRRVNLARWEEDLKAERRATARRLAPKTP